MKYRIKMMSKDEIFITQEEYQKILTSKAKGLVFIESLKGTVNLSSVETILPEELVPKKESSFGRLHDGTQVLKRFGRWEDAFRPKAHLDTSYYPEIATDTVMSEEEYQEKKTKGVLDRIPNYSETTPNLINP